MAQGADQRKELTVFQKDAHNRLGHFHFILTNFPTVKDAIVKLFRKTTAIWKFYKIPLTMLNYDTVIIGKKKLWGGECIFLQHKSGAGCDEPVVFG